MSSGDERARELLRELEANGCFSESTKWYKIRRKSDGLFSTGGSVPDWSAKGRLWGRIGHLKAHLLEVEKSARPVHNSLAAPARARHPYDGCEIVEFTSLSFQSESTPALKFLKAHLDTRQHALLFGHGEKCDICEGLSRINVSQDKSDPCQACNGTGRKQPKARSQK